MKRKLIEVTSTKIRLGIRPKIENAFAKNKNQSSW